MLIRKEADFTYNSTSGGVTYSFDIAVDAQGLYSVKNVESPRGPLDPTQGIPERVLRDIEEAKNIVKQQLAEASADSGYVTFTGELYQDVTIPAGVLNNTNYRVVYSSDVSLAFYASNLSTTGFRINSPVNYGSVDNPKTVSYTVLVSTQQSSACGGYITFVVADAGVKAVAFPTAFTTADYRVVLSPMGLFPVEATGRSRTGFNLNLGFTLATGDSVVCGYDVFV